jgi:hypothetical protein
MVKRYVFLLSIWIAFEMLHVGFNDSDLRLNIFIKPYPNPDGRYLTNIFYDFAVHWGWLAWTYIAWHICKIIGFYAEITKDTYLLKLKKFSYYLFALFLWRITELIFYFWFCNQDTNIYTLPILFIFIILAYAKARKNI